MRFTPAGACRSLLSFGMSCANQDRGAEPQAVPVGNLRPEILVMQPAQNWHRKRATDSLDTTRDRRVLVQFVGDDEKLLWDDDIWARSSQIGKYDKPLYLQQTYLL